MRHFRPTQEGWLRATPSEETLKWARRVEAEGDRTKPNDMLNFSERRYQGFVAERAFDTWLEHEQMSRVWNGQTDPKPDFELGLIGVGVKCCGSMRRWRPQLVVNVYERHREHPLQELFFVGFEHPGAVKRDGPTVVLLGGLPAEAYFARATFVRAGGQLNPRVIAENDVWNLQTSELQPPDEWLGRVRQ
jgi:hypothetical protein